MITLTFQFTDIAAASALLAKLNGTEQGAIVGAAEVVRGKPSAAKTAPSPHTAGAAPSPVAPPADVPALRETQDGHALTAREQLELHRSNPDRKSVV